MPNIKSAKKRVLVNKTRAARNKSRNTALKTSIKKAHAAVEAGSPEADIHRKYNPHTLKHSSCRNQSERRLHHA